MRVLGKAGSVFVFDNRLWVRTIACKTDGIPRCAACSHTVALWQHKAGQNYSEGNRCFIGVKYIPSWLNIHIRRPNSVEHRIQSEMLGVQPWGHWPFVTDDAYARIPAEVQPLFRHWLASEWVMTAEDAERAIRHPQGYKL